jgi:integrase
MQAYAVIAERLEPASVGVVHRTLRLALGQAVTWGQIPRNPALGATPPRRERREYQVWNGRQIAAFLQATADDETYGALWVVAADAGLRRAELIELRWETLTSGAGYCSSAAKGPRRGRWRRSARIGRARLNDG